LAANIKKLRLGVVGVGYLGKFHAEKYAAMENVDLIGVVDAHREIADGIASSGKWMPSVLLFQHLIILS
jgi:predicted dehydrogenase